MFPLVSGGGGGVHWGDNLGGRDPGTGDMPSTKVSSFPSPYLGGLI